MEIKIPISVGELFDKISILEIKNIYINNTVHKNFVENELSALMKILNSKNLNTFLDSELYLELKKTNEELWNICETRRINELKMNFDDSFVKLSRLEYKTNDHRAFIKLKINKYFNSDIVEVKSYTQ